jgi:D-beta-D-heptose 7-phosphate kinase/D-beta-D-heptose 1-phosphate adenosyltransferase
MEAATALKENPAIIQVKEWREKGLKIGFANGCFDILHAGHVNLLNTARSNCDRLIVGVTSDDNITKEKGKNRPIMDVNERAFILNGLAAVDMVIIITDPTPIRVLESLKPDIVAKGMDYAKIGFPEKEFLESYGCKIIFTPTINSSSALIAKCKKALHKKKN